LTMSMMLSQSARMRHFLFLLSSVFLAISLLPAAAAAQASSSSNPPSAPQPQDSRKYDVALSGFGQITGSANGNSIRVDTTESIGGLASFRQYSPQWFGYEVDYGLTRYSEWYNKKLGGSVTNNSNELTGAMLAQSRQSFYGLQPFATVGLGLMAFQPSPSKGYPTQLLPAFVYSLGVNHLVMSDHIGIRVQYRALEYKTPNFNQVPLDSHTLRTTMEPSFGVYYRF
jgi:hypothetical protein